MAQAQDPREIVVTARRVEERTENVPLKVNVVDGGEIATGAVEGLQSLPTRVPGLTFETAAGGFSEPVLRGQHQPNPTGDAATGVFVDGVYQASRDGKDVEPLDLERIEVVHGPQSALYGHSSFAGLIAYVPALPTERPLFSAAADFGSSELHGVRATVSGPIDAGFKGRLAAAWREADGTWVNAAAPVERFGNFRRFAVAATIATRDGSGPLNLRLSSRFQRDRSSEQPSFALGAGEYNCGARDPASGVWSYFCGVAPIPSQLTLSPGVPDSRSRIGQAALHLGLDLGGIELRSDSSFYQAEVTAIRDGDGSAQGELYGVCLVGLNCSGLGSLVIPVLRLQAVDRIGRTRRAVHEFAQELRLVDTGTGRFDWQLGGVVFSTRSHNIDAFGAERGALAANERFTALVLGNPSRVGPIAFINNALVADPNAGQPVQNDLVERRRTLAAFATAEWRPAERLRLRGEARATWERLVLDSRLAGFRSSFGQSLGARHFFDLTPRLSLDYRLADGWLGYVSYARGSRSGGINPQPNLLPEEQTFAPETNWTGELGLKYAGHGLVRRAEATGYHIDWRDTQIVGFAVTPGVSSLIIHNTRGIRTWGLELSAQLAPRPWLALDFGYSYAHPRFKRGSEDPGGSAFCGISANSTTSDFCRIVPSRSLPGQLVPDISGNRPSRAVATSWAAGMTVAPVSGLLTGWRLALHGSHQGNQFDRQIEALAFGARTLLDARLTVPLGPVAAELWGSNLTDERYVRAAAGGGGRSALFYPGQPRPQDFIPGERRRVGLTLRFPR